MFGKTKRGRFIAVTAIITAASLTIAALILLLTGDYKRGWLASPGSPVDERAVLPLDDTKLLSVAAASEGIRIREGTGNDIEARLHGMVGSAVPAAVPRLMVDRKGGVASIRLEHAALVISSFRNDLTLEVSVPAGYAGDLSVTTASGDITVAPHGYSTLELSTKSGNVKMESATAGHADVRTSSGDIDFDSFSGDISARTTSGDVTVRMPADASFRLDAASTSGDVSCGFPITIAANRPAGGRHSLAGTVGAAEAGSEVPTVSVRTVSGDIAVVR